MANQIVPYSPDMTIQQFQNNFVLDAAYRNYCGKKYKKYPPHAIQGVTDKQAMCFLMAVFFGGIASVPNAKGAKGLFLRDVLQNPARGNRKSGGWTPNAAHFYNKDAKTFSKDVFDPIKEKYGKNSTLKKTVDDVLAFLITQPVTNKNPNAMQASAQRMLTLLTTGYVNSLSSTPSSAPSSAAKPSVTDEKVKLMLELLKSNHQLILNGAPGTGKTYTAKNKLAPALMGNNQYDPFRVEMVQFHPSYDYTDFIEGIRPNLDPSGSSLSYVLKNGSFKEFCCKAGVIERIKAANETVNDSTIKKFLHLPQDDSSDDNALFKFWKTWHENHEDGDPLPPFLFIIDEINRAEISKVIGEVMFCLDPDYRGEKGKIHTQYATSATNDSFFLRPKDDEFFIPSNVYIVGTMNDIDRSVEVFDFALRRRFAWYEVKADEWMKPVLANMFSASPASTALASHFGDYLTRANALNEAVTEVMGSRHFCLGPVYFGKLRNYININGSNYDDALKKVWDNHICQILTEYVKGRRDADVQVKALQDKFLPQGSGEDGADPADDAS